MNHQKNRTEIFLEKLNNKNLKIREKMEIRTNFFPIFFQKKFTTLSRYS